MFSRELGELYRAPLMLTDNAYVTWTIIVCYVDYHSVNLGYYVLCQLSLCAYVCYVDYQCVRYVDCHYLCYVNYHCDMLHVVLLWLCHHILSNATVSVFCWMCVLPIGRKIVKCHCLFRQILLCVLSNGTVLCGLQVIHHSKCAIWLSCHSAALFFGAHHLEALSVLFVISSLRGYCWCFWESQCMLCGQSGTN